MRPRSGCRHSLLTSSMPRRRVNDMKRVRASYYTGQFNGVECVVEWHTTAYGDSGWFVWIGSERSDYPRQTKSEAVELARSWAAEAHNRKARNA